MHHISIIGGGFAGTITAVQLIQKCFGPLEITLVSDAETLNRGIAYNPYSKLHLLNVIAKYMSAFSDRPDHFVDWAMQQEAYSNTDREVIAHAFLPRYLYGKYINEIWRNALLVAAGKNIKVNIRHTWVTDIDNHDTIFHLTMQDGKGIFCNSVVVATGNQVPRNHPIANQAFYYTSKNYYRSPWQNSVITGLGNSCPVLLLGNSLTMVDTVLALHEQGLGENIISISPNGFNLLPHRHNGIQYNRLLQEADDQQSLHEWLELINKHRKQVRKLGVTAEPIIDSLRPVTHHIWQHFSPEEKQMFSGKLKHFWNIARHRVPVQIHDQLQQWRLQGRLNTYAGNITNLIDGNDFVRVEFFDKKTRQPIKLDVSRVINCSGPESDISRMDDCFLKRCLNKGMVRQDALKLGIDTDWPGFRILDATGKPQQGFYTLGANLRGLLWETTAVKEIREQAVLLADSLKERHQQWQQQERRQTAAMEV